MDTNNEKNHTEYKNQNGKIPDKCNDGGADSVEEMRARLNAMKQLMREKNNAAANILNAETPTRRPTAGIIDGSFLSAIFMFVLLGVIGCGALTFYSLYKAVVKKYQTRHDEL